MPPDQPFVVEDPIGSNIRQLSNLYLTHLNRHNLVSPYLNCY